MLGVIRTRDILANPLVTIRCFGWTVFLRALTARKGQTFLGLLCEARPLETSTTEVPELLARCIELEGAAQRIYETLAERFGGDPRARAFFRLLAEEESCHAELLALCREAATRARWDDEPFAPWRDAVPRLEEQMQEAEASLGALPDLREALRLVLRIEASEINEVFTSIVAATDSDFIRAIHAFQVAEKKHCTHLGEEIGTLDPSLSGECRAFLGQTV